MGTGNFEKSKNCVIERRDYFRIDVPKQETLLVTLGLGGRKHTKSRLINISVGGAAIAAAPYPTPCEIGSRIKEITFMLPGGKEVRSSGVVRHISRESNSELHRYGIQFCWSSVPHGIYQIYKIGQFPVETK